MAREMTPDPDILDRQAAANARPRRQRGLQRLQILNEATNSLLLEKDVSEIGLYQIAERAGVPTASIYHFFPNKEAALIALAESHLKAMLHAAQADPLPRPTTWQELIEARVRSGAAYYNAHTAIMKLFLGASISSEVRKTDMAGTLAAAQIRADLMARHFKMPEIHNWVSILANTLALCDGIWALSFSQSGRILPEAIDESVRATISYLRFYLPEFLSPYRANVSQSGR